MNDYQTLIHVSRYARWKPEESRRETWEETVTRYCDFWKGKFQKEFPYKTIHKAILDMDVMPSMRAMMTAGEALDRDNIAGYNCSYVPIDSPRAFDEIMYILMCGTGVGFSVESKYVNKLPVVSEEFHATETTIKVPDSRIGWASSLRELVSLLYSGRVPKIDTSLVRAAGTRLKTFGGRASGPEPLQGLFNFLEQMFRKAAGRKLTTLEVHDVVCKIADVVIVGGVRRSALISLSDLGDNRMATAKSGNWWNDFPHRALANNSAVYNGRPDFDTFIKEWNGLYQSRSGERGIFNRNSAASQAASGGRGRNVGDFAADFGTNPCGEIILRPNGLCNLTEVIIRPDDTSETLRAKVERAAILGTFQSTLTNFRYLRKAWQKNAEEERLLGVSLTGIYDNLLTSTPQSKGLLNELKELAVETNKKWADRLGITASVGVTCVKPSGTVSQLVGCSSGIHPAFSEYYYRTVRMDNKDPLTSFLRSQGVRNEPENYHPDSQTVFYFPMKSAPTSVTVDMVNGMSMCHMYKAYRDGWCEHNPSITVYYKDDDFLEIGNWVWNNFDNIGGIAFLPQSDHVYEQAPYIKITKEEYEKAIKDQPKINWEAFVETEDSTTATHELACSAGVCEV